MGKILLSLILILAAPAFAGTTNKHAHVHGAAKITLALESFKEGTINLDVPAESIYGFEHKANTKAEKEAQEKGFKPLKGNPYSIIRVPSDCEIKVVKVEIEKAEEGEQHEAGHKEDEHHGEHADINASYSLKCVNSLAGVKLWVPMFDVFPRVKAVSLQVLSPNGQMEKKFTNSNEYLIVPKLRDSCR